MNNKSAVEGEENLLTCLADLFTQVTSVPKHKYIPIGLYQT